MIITRHGKFSLAQLQAWIMIDSASWKRNRRQSIPNLKPHSRNTAFKTYSRTLSSGNLPNVCQGWNKFHSIVSFRFLKTNWNLFWDVLVSLGSEVWILSTVENQAWNQIGLRVSNLEAQRGRHLQNFIFLKIEGRISCHPNWKKSKSKKPSMMTRIPFR